MVARSRGPRIRAEDPESKNTNTRLPSYTEFKKVFLKELNKHVPLKKKILRHNNNALITKELRKEIILR